MIYTRAHTHRAPRHRHRSANIVTAHLRSWMSASWHAASELGASECAVAHAPRSSLLRTRRAQRPHQSRATHTSGWYRDPSMPSSFTGLSAAGCVRLRSEERRPPLSLDQRRPSKPWRLARAGNACRRDPSPSDSSNRLSVALHSARRSYRSIVIAPEHEVALRGSSAIDGNSRCDHDRMHAVHASAAAAAVSRARNRARPTCGGIA